MIEHISIDLAAVSVVSALSGLFCLWRALRLMKKIDEMKFGTEDTYEKKRYWQRFGTMAGYIKNWEKDSDS